MSENITGDVEVEKRKHETTGYVYKKCWDHDDYYSTVEVQVDSSMFKNGQKVKVTVEEMQ